jgi:hypothetical protein
MRAMALAKPAVGCYWTGFIAAAGAGALLLLLSPYRDASYASVRAHVYVDTYQDDAFLPDVAHRVSGIGARIAAADVVMVGSSRMLFGLSAAALQARFQDRVAFFNLGIGGGEGARGIDELVARLDLRDKTLLVNLDDNMFRETPSRRMKSALGMDRFRAATRVYSVRLHATSDTWLDRIGLPRLSVDGSGLRLGPRREPRLYRDRRNGDALEARATAPPPPGAALAPAPQGARLPESELERAHFRRIVEGWKARGLRLIFVAIPYAAHERTGYNPDLPRAAALRYGGDAVALDWRLARTVDGIHVDRASRERLSRQLGEELARARSLLARR